MLIEKEKPSNKYWEKEISTKRKWKWWKELKKKKTVVKRNLFNTKTEITREMKTKLRCVLKKKKTKNANL